MRRSDLNASLIYISRINNRNYNLTDGRIIELEGLLKASRSEVPLDTVRGVIHQQSLHGRILQYGKTLIDPSATQHPVTFHFIPKPVAHEERILRQQESYRT